MAKSPGNTKSGGAAIPGKGVKVPRAKTPTGTPNPAVQALASAIAQGLVPVHHEPGSSTLATAPQTPTLNLTTSKGNTAVVRGGPQRLSNANATAGGFPTPGQLPPVTPFLTPDQQQALTVAVNTYNQTIGDILQNTGDPSTGNKTGDQQTLAADAIYNNNRNATIKGAAVDANAGARGMFESSIRAGDLNDIAATTTMRNNLVTTKLNSAIAKGNRALSAAGSSLTATRVAGLQDAVTNAQNVTPDLGGPNGGPPTAASDLAASHPFANTTPTPTTTSGINPTGVSWNRGDSNHPGPWNTHTGTGGTRKSPRNMKNNVAFSLPTAPAGMGA